MKAELLTNTENEFDFKKLFENIESIKSTIDIYSIFIEENVIAKV